MLRIDMQNLGFDSINKYAIGEDNLPYTNKIAMFSRINFARMHYEISSLRIKVLRDPDKARDTNWEELYKAIKELNSYGFTK